MVAKDEDDNILPADIAAILGNLPHGVTHYGSDFNMQAAEPEPTHNSEVEVEVDEDDPFTWQNHLNPALTGYYGSYLPQSTYTDGGSSYCTCDEGNEGEDCTCMYCCVCGEFNFNAWLENGGIRPSSEEDGVCPECNYSAD